MPWFSSLVILILALASMGWSASETTIRAHTVTGEVTFQKAGKGDWAPVRVGAKIKQADRIRTAVESQVGLQFADGSLVTISENSLIEMKTLTSGEGVANTKLGVKTGKVLFNIQKLAGGRSSFEFEAQTATAAIRGTEGDVQVNGSRSTASLLTGKLEMISPAGRASIGPGQMVLQTPTGFVVLPKPKDQKSYQQLVDKYLKDTTSTSDSLINDIKKKLDSLGVVTPTDTVAPTVKGDTARVDSAIAVPSVCVIDAYPAETKEARLLITGKAPDGAEVSSGAAKVMATGGVWKLDLAWSPDRYGQRTYTINAALNGTKMPCGDVSFMYLEQQIPLSLKLTMPNPTEICRGPLILSGSYLGTGARLLGKLGGMSIDLSNSTGSFTKSVPVSDQSRNWDIEQVEFVLSNPSNSISEVVRLKVNRTCKDVNRISPTIIGSAQPSICVLSLGIGAVQGDEVRVSVLSDGSEIESFVTTSDIRGRRVSLQDGNHSYLVRAVDLANNKTEQSFPNVTCWPDVRFDIVIEGNAKEVLRIPPPPPGVSDLVTRTLDFEVRNLPRDDFGYLKRVTVRQDGRTLKEWRQTQIRDIRFSTDVNLTRGKPNIIRIEVEAQNGRIRTAIKEYDFR